MAMCMVYMYIICNVQKYYILGDGALDKRSMINYIKTKENVYIYLYILKTSRHNFTE